MSKKQQLGQFYTRNADYICQNLISIFPENAIVVDPFAGEWDLLFLVADNRPTTELEGYDIDPKNDMTQRRDSLKNSIALGGKWVVTNPPYLAKNKSENKTHFLNYDTTDLYKCAIKMLAGFGNNSPCEGGILIVPLNFFSDNDDAARKYFLSRYEIVTLNIFEEQVFEDTSYTVCSFSFIKKENDEQDIQTHFVPSGEQKRFRVRSADGYRIGEDFIYKATAINSTTIRVGRLVKGKPIPDGWSITSLFVRAIDTGTTEGRIKLQIRDEPYYGKDSDKTFATLICSRQLTEDQLHRIVRYFNNFLEGERRKDHSMFLTNFRNSTREYARKRLDFASIYKLVEYFIAATTPGYNVVIRDFADLECESMNTSQNLWIYTRPERSAKKFEITKLEQISPEERHRWIERFRACWKQAT